MKLLLDTNVISEQQRPQPDAGVDRFLDEVPEDRLFLSMATIAELHRGVALLPADRRRSALGDWLTSELPERFGERLLPISLPIAASWGELMAASHRSGQNLSVMDGWIAATAAAHELAVVTRNTRHFAGLGLTVINPWTGA